MKRLYEAKAYQNEVGSWWELTDTPPVWSGLHNDMTTGTVIIGAGYTGLNCALELAENAASGDDLVILDARQPGWGASGRNGGFCCMGGNKLPFDSHVRRFGTDETNKYYREQISSVETVQNLLERYAIAADVHSFGETLLAHREDQFAELENEAWHLGQMLKLKPKLIGKADLEASGLRSAEFHAALTNPVGFALNPMKYTAGLARQVEKPGIHAFGNTPALSITKKSGGWLVETPGGKITADNLVIATNGYSSEDIPDWLGGRLLPALTNIIVTRPLTPTEIAGQGWTSNQMCYDTRNSLHYFRLMPAARGESGPRMLFGMRAGTRATPASHNRMRQRIRADFDRIFPAWRSVETPWFWSGLVCLTRDLLSFTGPLPGMKNAYASLAYHGNGVAMGSHCGRLLAQMISGDISAESLPAAMRQPPRKFPFAPLRRKYLAAAYKWYEWHDG